MVLGGCLSTREAYRSDQLVERRPDRRHDPHGPGAGDHRGGAPRGRRPRQHPGRPIAGSPHGLRIFLLTTGFSQVINNTATAVLVAPIVIQAATDLGVSPHPLLMIVAVSASTAFLTPIGTTTNILVFSPGGYQFTDYVKVGLPLMLLFLAVSLVLVPVIWPL